MKVTDNKASMHVTVSKKLLIAICNFQAPVVLGEDPVPGNEIQCLLIIIQNSPQYVSIYIQGSLTETEKTRCFVI